MHKVLIQPPHKKISFNTILRERSNVLKNCKIKEGKVHNRFIKKAITDIMR